MKLDILGGLPLPNCPYAGSTLPANSASPLLHNPSISIIHLLACIICVGLAVITATKYNKLRIFNRVVEHQSINNILYFWMLLAMSTAFLVDGLRYSLNLPFDHRTSSSVKYIRNSGDSLLVGPQVMDAWLLLVSSFARSASGLLLTFAMNQQVVHKCSGPGTFNWRDSNHDINGEAVAESSNAQSASQIVSNMKFVYSEARDSLFRGAASPESEIGRHEEIDHEQTPLLANGQKISFLSLIEVLVRHINLVSFVIFITRGLVMLLTMYYSVNK